MQITGAYNLLKSLTAEELQAAASGGRYELLKHERKRQKSEAEIDSILDKYELKLNDYYSHSDSQQVDIKAAVLRLKSHNNGAVHAVLKHSAHLANKAEFRIALSEYLNGSEIDEACADVIASLPFDNLARRQLALDAAHNASNLPLGLIISLMGNEQAVIESFLPHIKPEDCAAVLRRWPSGKTMNINITRHLLESDDARVLVPVLSLMRSFFPAQASQHKHRLSELEYHHAVAVRALAKKLIGH